MANVLLAVKSNKPGSATITLIDGETATGYRLMGVDLGSAEYDLQFSGMRGTQGARLAGATALNRLSVWRLQTVGVTEDDLEAKLSTLWGLDEELRRYGGTVTWRPQGSSFRMYLDVLSSGCKIESYDDLWPRDHRLTVSFGVVTPPYMEGDPFDILDDFSTDTEASYTFDTGSASDVAVTGGSLTASGNLTVEKRLIHTDRGYTYGDQQVTIKATPGSTITSFLAGVVLKRIDASNYLRVYVDDNGTNSRLRIDKVVAGVTTNLATTNLGARVVNGVAFWVRGRVEGVNVYAEFFTAAPSPMATPTTTNNYTLTGSEITTFGTTVTGKAGVVWIPQQSAATIDDFDVDPFTYRNWTLPELLSLYGTIPGDGPSLFDVYITPSGGSAAPVWSALGWWPRAGAHNLCQNGDFESGLLLALGWSVAAVTNINAAASSITQTADANIFGAFVGRIVTPATVDSGANFRIFRRFKKGVTYTFDVWVRAPSGATTNVYARMGNGVANDKATSGNTALSAAKQKLTVAWTPSADRDDAHIAINIAAATGTTFDIDGVTVYEGVVAPTGPNQTEGRGGFPPFAVVEAENALVASGAVTSNANFRSGFGIATTSRAKVVIDPSLARQDDYTQGDIAIEVWARLEVGATEGGSSLPLKLSAQPISASANLPTLYSEEFGTSGHIIVQPSSGTVRRFVRAGTLRLPTNAGRYLVVVENTGASTISYDYLLLVPANGRALGPSGKANDSSFPKFVPVTSEVTRRIRSDLSGTLNEPATGTAEIAAPGLGGSLLEFPSVDIDAVLKLSSLVPDDPTSDTTTEQLAHSATVHFAVTPRWRLGRGS
jgi:hypothetical protein